MKKALTEIWNAEDKNRAIDAVKTFEAAYGAKFPKAVAKIINDLDQLLAFYDFRPSTGCISELPIPSSRLSRPCATEARSPKDRVHARPESPWPTS